MKVRKSKKIGIRIEPKKYEEFIQLSKKLRVGRGKIIRTYIDTLIIIYGVV